MSNTRRKFFNSIGVSALGVLALNVLPVKFIKNGKTENKANPKVMIHPLAVNRNLKGDG
ncbi:MAG: hypothetical protein KGZ71_00665 [Desulfobulbaceae bacterium]|nr:hypothetical protein [Candidatus Kapabacteria bacterium]MBS3998971.1 hypothetical protein [Desulfobulbaceae bacterium]